MKIDDLLCYSILNQNAGDLDVYNGRFAITPEYPQGVYAYYVTIDANGASAYPYILGPQYYGVVAQDNFGSVTITEPVKTYHGPTTSVNELVEMPREFALQQNYPNPFWSGAISPARSGGNPATMISYSITKPVNVQLRIYNLHGQKVRTLVNTRQTVGDYTIGWDGKNDFGRLVANGGYFYQLSAGGFQSTKLMLLLK